MNQNLIDQQENGTRQKSPKNLPENKSTDLYRMVMEKHICPYGLKAKDLLKREGYEVKDHHLTTREETDQFKEKHNVKTTPQIFIGGERIGGYTDLRKHLGKDVKDKNETTYQPVIALFSMTALMAIAAASVATGQFLSWLSLQWFVAFSMCGLAYLKLRDIESFSTMFLNYDLLAKRWVRYGYIYPFAEGIAGVFMIASFWLWLAGPVALLIGTIGAISVVKAVYIDKRELKCACVGGDSNVPLGFISLTENLFMIAMGIWVGVKLLS